MANKYLEKIASFFKKKHEDRVFEFRGKHIHSADVKHIPGKYIGELKDKGPYKHFDAKKIDLPYGPKRDKVFHFSKDDYK